MDEEDLRITWMMITASKKFVEGPLEEEVGQMSETQRIAVAGLLCGFLTGCLDKLAPREDGRRWQQLFDDLRDEMLPDMKGQWPGGK